MLVGNYNLWLLNIYNEPSQAYMYHIRWKNPSEYKGWLRFLFFPTDENEDQAYAKFMRAHKCYDLIPTSAKLVIFDTKLNVSISEVG